MDVQVDNGTEGGFHLEHWQLRQMQALPLEAKVNKSKLRIREWLDHWNGMVYVSFSGGKDSAVALEIARQVDSDIPAVFCDTGLEFPEVRSFVQSIENVVWIRPEIPFKKVIEDVGYPVVSKEQSSFIQEYRDTKSDKLKKIRWEGNDYGMGKISERWKHLVNAPFKISDRCCDIMKKRPFSKYENETGRKMITGEMAVDSLQRRSHWLEQGCNAFDRKRPKSTPLGFWKDKDIWEYIRTRNLDYPSVYDKGWARTGCMFCMFGIHREETPNRFQRMARTHPKQYDFCMRPVEEGGLGLSEVLDCLGVDHEEVPEQLRLWEGFDVPTRPDDAIEAD